MIIIKKRDCGKLGVLYIAYRKYYDPTQRHGHRNIEYVIAGTESREKIELCAHQHKLEENITDSIVTQY